MIDKSLPLTDLHRHLDGNIRPQTILELGRQHNIQLPAFELEALRPHVQIVENEPSLVAFLKKLDWGVAVLADYDACRRVAYENVEDLLRAGIDYAELRFSPAYMAMAHRLHPQGVVEAIIDGVAAGSRDFGIKANLIGIMSRTFGTEQCNQELAACLAHRDKLVAIDLAGDELGFPGNSLSTTSTRCAMQACASPYTLVKPLAPKAFGRPFASWVPSVSATVSKRFRIRP